MKSRSIPRQHNIRATEKPEEKALAVLSCAKRSPTERRGIHAWHPYYAGYSEAFVESALDFFGASRTSLVLDPWGGSGTTGIVSARRGIPSVSIDINPVMATFAAAKSIEVLAYSQAIKNFFASAIWLDDQIERAPDASNIYEQQTANILHSLFSAIPIFENLGRQNSNAHGVPPSEAAVFLSPPAAFCRAVTFVAVRKKMGRIRLTNPTWVRKGEKAISISANDLKESLIQTADDMLATLADFYRNGISVSDLWSMNGDAKKIDLMSDSIDFVITSPPYLTRIDYAVSTLPELYLLGDMTLIREVRHKTTGAPVITRDEKYQKQAWGELCNNILDAIKVHPTQAAAGYYWKHITQYFTDIDISLSEIKRVLRPGGAGLLVVQSSYFKDIEISLGEIFVQMAKQKQLVARIVSRQVVKGHMAHKNTKSTAYKNNKIYFEDVVLVEKL